MSFCQRFFWNSMLLLVSRFILFIFSFTSNMNEVIMQLECLIRNSSVAFNLWVGEGRSTNFGVADNDRHKLLSYSLNRIHN